MNSSIARFKSGTLAKLPRCTTASVNSLNQRSTGFSQLELVIERHWDGIAAYCKPENKVALGCVEDLNNKIRVIQRRTYGLRDEEFLRLKVLTCMLPAL